MSKNSSLSFNSPPFERLFEVGKNDKSFVPVQTGIWEASGEFYVSPDSDGAVVTRYSTVRSETFQGVVDALYREWLTYSD